jgi:hypothetical protein
MSVWIGRSKWFSRLVLAGAAVLMTRVGMGTILNPVGEAGRHHTTLGSPDAITVVRVEGGIFLGMAAVVVYCLVSERRLLAGLAFFGTIITAITAARLLGLALDGSGAFTLMVLKPEVVLVVLSALAITLERIRVTELVGPASHPPRALR